MLPVFQPAPMKRWSYDVFKARPIPPLTLPTFLTTSTERPYSGEVRRFHEWYHTWK
jgi:hypothetical protein